MTDQLLEQRLQDWYRDQFDETLAAPAGLRASVHEITAVRPRVFGFNRRSFALLAAAVVATLVLAIAIAVGSNRFARQTCSAARSEPQPRSADAVANADPDAQPHAFEHI